MRARLPPALWKLCWISFLLDVSSEMVYPLIPLFLATTLHAPAAALGLIEGAADGLVSVITALTGKRSDQNRRRVPYIRVGYAMSAASKPALGLAATWGAAFGLRLCDRLGKGVRTAARDAMIADLATPQTRGAAFGLHRAMDTAGACTGVLIALLLIQLLPGDYRSIFLLTAIPGLAAVLLAFSLRELPRASDPPADARGWGSWRGLPRRYWIAAGVMWLFGLANSSDAFLLLRARDWGLSDRRVILAYGLLTLVYALVALPAGRWSDRVGRRSVLALGAGIYALVYAGFAWLDARFVWPLFAAYGAVLGMMQGVAKAWIADLAPATSRATALGVFHMGTGLAVFVSSALTGWLWDLRGPQVPLLAASTCAALAALLLGTSGRGFDARGS